MLGKKTGGRIKGVSRNKPKVPTSVNTPVVSDVATAAPAGAAPGGLLVPSQARARPEARDPALRRYRMQRIDALIAYERNPRTHSPAQVDLIAKLITEFGFTNPVLVDGKRGIIAGHGRVLAAQKLGMVMVPTLELSHLNAVQRRAYVIADNKSAERAGWDNELLALDLGELRDEGFNLDLTGFDGRELASLLGDAEGLTDPDAVPDVPVDPVTARGDVWLLGRHRIMCGDSTDPNCVERLMQGAQADLCFTSPPYSQQRDYQTGPINWDQLMQGVFGILPLKEHGQLLVNLGLVHRDNEWLPYWEGWVEWMRAAGWRRFGWYVWDQGPGLPGNWNGRLAPAHEWIFHFNRHAINARKSKAKLAASIQYNDHGNGMRRKDGSMSGVHSPGKSLQTHKVPDSIVRVLRRLDEIGLALLALTDEDVSHWPESVVHIMRHKARGIETKHPAVFPVALPGEVLRAYSDPGDLLYEPFCGSGSSIIAAEQHDRRCFGLDLSAGYVDVAVQRWQAFTGQQAVLEASGLTFAGTKADRLSPAKPARIRAPRAKVAA
jgi:DNA modification methylase